MVVLGLSLNVLGRKSDHNCVEQSIAQLRVCKLTHGDVATATACLEQAGRADVNGVVTVAVDDIFEPVGWIVLVLDLYYISFVDLAVMPIGLIPSNLDTSVHLIVIDIKVNTRRPCRRLHQQSVAPLAPSPLIHAPDPEAVARHPIDIDAHHVL